VPALGGHACFHRGINLNDSGEFSEIIGKIPLEGGSVFRSGRRIIQKNTCQGVSPSRGDSLFKYWFNGVVRGAAIFGVEEKAWRLSAGARTCRSARSRGG